MWDTLGYYKIWAEKHWPREWLLNSDSCWVNRLSHLTSINLIFLICKTKLSADLLHSSGWQHLGKYWEWASPCKGLTPLSPKNFVYHRADTSLHDMKDRMAWKGEHGSKLLFVIGREPGGLSQICRDIQCGSPCQDLWMDPEGKWAWSERKH